MVYSIHFGQKHAIEKKSSILGRWFLSKPIRTIEQVKAFGYSDKLGKKKSAVINREHKQKVLKDLEKFSFAALYQQRNA